MSEIGDLVAILGEIERVVSADEHGERRAQVADLVPGYCEGDRFKWFGRVASENDLDLPTVEEAMGNLADPTRFASIRPGGTDEEMWLRWHDFVTRNSDRISGQLARLPSPCSGSVIEHQGGPGHALIAVLQTAVCVRDIELTSRAARLLEPANRPQCSAWWCGMHRLPARSRQCHRRGGQCLRRQGAGDHPSRRACWGDRRVRDRPVIRP